MKYMFGYTFIFALIGAVWAIFEGAELRTYLFWVALTGVVSCIMELAANPKLARK